MCFRVCVIVCAFVGYLCVLSALSHPVRCGCVAFCVCVCDCVSVVRVFISLSVCVCTVCACVVRVWVGACVFCAYNRRL